VSLVQVRVSSEQA